MPEHASLPFLRIPPFPGARGSRLAERGEAGASEPSSADLVAALREARVGGTFWGARPALPPGPYLLLRGIGAQAPASVRHLPIVRWLDRSAAVARRGETIVAGPCDPWHLVDGAAVVVCGSDEALALVAALAGKPLVHGDSGEPTEADAAEVEPMVRQLLLDGWVYRNPFTGAPEGVLDAVLHCAAWRALIDTNRPLAGAIGFARWKRTTTEALLWGGERAVRFDPNISDLQPGDQVAAWRSRVSPAVLHALNARGVELVEVEDGFVRSVGLGADCVPPLSIVVDRLGPHFDPRRESEFERLLEQGTFAPKLLKQAELLRQQIVGAGLSKYDVGHVPLARRADRAHVLVPGQVEDDRAVLSTVGEPLMNLNLLKRARAAEPSAYLLYKPHPDVEAGHRRGGIPDAEALTLADEVIRDVPMSSVIALVDRLHVNSSLAGFEALLRGKTVVTHGVPFYAGWGLTDDRGPVPPRRSTRRSLDELIAATLLVYPRYLDPTTGLPCPAEIVVARLAEGGARPAPSALVTLRRLQGRVRQQLGFLGEGA